MWQPKWEAIDREELRAIQETRFKNMLQHIIDNAPVQRKKLGDFKTLPGLSDLHNLPFTVKDDFRDNYPFGLFAVPRSKIVRLQGTSGTTGKPTINGYTQGDLLVWKDLIARIVTAVGVTKEDLAQVCFGYGLFTGGFGLHQGLEHVGATVLPMSSGNTEKQIMMMIDLQSSVLVATPSYALYLSEVVEQMGVRDKLNLRIGLFGGEGCSDEMRATIEHQLGIIATNNYGMCELVGPGVSGECIHRNGLHIAEDHFYPEIINPDTGEVLPEGEQGELVITALTRECCPIIRYRTRDITRLIYEPCECGRTHIRMAPTRGRSDDMLIIKGVNVFPSQIESVLVGMEHIGPHYLLFVRREGVTDTLEVQVELADAQALEHFAMLEKIQKEIRDKLRVVLGLSTKVTLVAPQTIERFQGKAKRVVDLRK